MKNKRKKVKAIIVLIALIAVIVISNWNESGWNRATTWGALLLGIFSANY
ncbi:hypothetical protein [uncultured Clostridium sp.]|nr:hypothetical protein [uncultured Clostridium sp.]